VIFHYLSLNEQATITKLLGLVNKASGEISQKNPRFLPSNSTAKVRIKIQRPICIETFHGIIFLPNPAPPCLFSISRMQPTDSPQPSKISRNWEGLPSGWRDKQLPLGLCNKLCRSNQYKLEKKNFAFVCSFLNYNDNGC